MATAPPVITALPTPPDPNDRATFNTRAYPWSVAQQTLATEVGAVAANVYGNATEAGTQAGIATTQASNATTQAGLAATARIAAQAAQVAAEGVVASIPDGTINDATTALTSVWSSSKVSAELAAKQATLVSGTNIKTVGGASLLGVGDLTVSSNLAYEARTSNTILGTADKAKVIRYTTGGFTQTFTGAATLTSGWFVYLQNTSTSNVTLDPNSSETIDGLTTGVLAPGMALLVICTGTAFQVVRLDNSPITEVKTSGTSWTCPLGVVRAEVTVVGAGGGANASNTAGGGGGTAIRAYNRLTPGTAYTYSVGSASIHSAGGNSTFTDGVTTITGGGAALSTSAYEATVGGIGTNGDINVQGGTGFVNPSITKKQGGNSLFGSGASSDRPVAPATGYGGGGCNADESACPTPGVVIIKY